MIALCGFRWLQYGAGHSCEEMHGHPGLHMAEHGQLTAFAFSGQPEGTETLEFRREIIPYPQKDDL